MARPHRPVRRGTYEKRRVAGSPPPTAPPGDILTSADARHLGARIDSAQERYRTTAIRLMSGRACGLVLLDSRTGTERILTSVDDWDRLQTE